MGLKPICIFSFFPPEDGTRCVVNSVSKMEPIRINLFCPYSIMRIGDCFLRGVGLTSLLKLGVKLIPYLRAVDILHVNASFTIALSDTISLVFI